MSRFIHSIPIVLVLALALGGCDSDQLPNEAALAISPSENTTTVTATATDEDSGICRIDPDYYLDVPFVIALRDGQGTPIGDAELNVHASYSANFFSGYPIMALYEDRNGNGVVDAETELVSGAEDGIARVKTSRYGGEHVILLRKNLSCAYRGYLSASIGGVHASAPVSVIDESAEAGDDADTDDDEADDADEERGA